MSVCAECYLIENRKAGCGSMMCPSYCQPAFQAFQAKGRNTKTTDRQTEKKTEKQTDRQTDKETNRQKNRLTDRQAGYKIYIKEYTLRLSAKCCANTI